MFWNRICLPIHLCPLQCKAVPSNRLPRSWVSCFKRPMWIVDSSGRNPSICTVYSLCVLQALPNMGERWRKMMTVCCHEWDTIVWCHQILRCDLECLSAKGFDVDWVYTNGKPAIKQHCQHEQRKLDDGARNPGALWSHWSNVEPILSFKQRPQWLYLWPI